jgi:pimeloyl-ACP methyl ester carboxylesterase
MVYRNSRIKLSAGRISWREAGDSHRPVTIFLHGSWHDNRQWNGIVDPLTENFYCFILDLPGFGNSIADRVPDSIEQEVDCLHEFVTALKLRPVYLVGHSLGAWIAMSYTLKYPDLVRGVVAISPEGFALPNWQQYGLATKWMLSQAGLFRLWLNSLQAIVAVSDSAYPLAKSLAYWRFFNEFPTTCKLFFQRSTKEIRSELVTDRLAQFRPPLLVLQADTDARLSIEQNQSRLRVMRQAEFRLFKSADLNASDVLMLDLTKEIQDFFDRVQAQIDREEVELW